MKATRFFETPVSVSQLHRVMSHKARIFSNSAARSRDLPVVVEEPASSRANCIPSTVLRLVSLRSFHLCQDLPSSLASLIMKAYASFFLRAKYFKHHKKRFCGIAVVSRQIYYLVFNVFVCILYRQKAFMILQSQECSR
jgi:hypothetical protein